MLTVSQVSLFLAYGLIQLVFKGTWVTFWVFGLPCGLVQNHPLLSKERYSLFCGLFFDLYF